MKRVVLLLLTLLFVLTACGKGEVPASSTQSTPISSAPEDGERIPVVEVGGQLVVVDETLEQSGFTEADFIRMAETGRMECVSRKAVTGIDVSYHQGEIDWAAVAGDGIDFAMLRIGNRGYSQGSLKEDPLFEDNYTGAGANGLDVGVYFFSQAITVEEAVEEAEFVLSILEGRELQMPVVFDWEEIEGDVARTDDVDTETVTACAIAFCQRIGEAGYDTAVYCNGMVGYFRYDIAQLQHLPIWYAEYSGWPSFAYAMEMWQYTSSGKVAGVSGNADLNLYFPNE